jgi:hypothetical protein
MVRKTITPLIYSLFLIPVFLGTVLILNFIERNYGLHTIYRVGDIDAVVVITLLGGFFFFLGNSAVAALEPLHQISFSDHIRHSSIFYILTLIGSFGLVSTYHEMSGALSYASAVIVCFISLLAIAVNAGFLLIKTYKRQKKFILGR